jgi:hypothetical protein
LTHAREIVLAEGERQAAGGFPRALNEPASDEVVIEPRNFWKAGLKEKFAGERSQARFEFIVVLLIGATYSYSFQIIGEVRLAELLLLALFMLRPKIFKATIPGRGHAQIALFILAAIAILFSDIVNGNDVSDNLIKRCGTYILLAIETLLVLKLLATRPSLTGALVGGWSLSFVLTLAGGLGVSASYLATPWPLGLGMATTFVVCMGFKTLPILYQLPIMMMMAGLHVYMGARSLFIVTMLVVSVMLANVVIRSLRLRVTNSAAFLFVGAALIIGPAIAQYAVEIAGGSEELGAYAEKYRVQLANPYGPLLGARGDLGAAWSAIQRSPLIGLGPSHEAASEDLVLWARLVSYNMPDLAPERAIAYIIENYELRGTPSHSHVLSAWLEGGILAALCWAFTLYIAFCAVRWGLSARSPWLPATLFATALMVWEIVLSPGPNRLQEAILIALMLLATIPAGRERIQRLAVPPSPEPARRPWLRGVGGRRK